MGPLDVSPHFVHLLLAQDIFPSDPNISEGRKTNNCIPLRPHGPAVPERPSEPRWTRAPRVRAPSTQHPPPLGKGQEVSLWHRENKSGKNQDMHGTHQTSRNGTRVRAHPRDPGRAVRPTLLREGILRPPSQSRDSVSAGAGCGGLSNKTRTGEGPTANAHSSGLFLVQLTTKHHPTLKTI